MYSVSEKTYNYKFMQFFFMNMHVKIYIGYLTQWLIDFTNSNILWYGIYKFSKEFHNIYLQLHIPSISVETKLKQ